MGQQRDGRPRKVKTFDGGGTTRTPSSEEVDYDDLVALDGPVDIEKEEREKRDREGDSQLWRGFQGGVEASQLAALLSECVSGQVKGPR